MKTTHAVESDERTVAVTNAIYTRGYFFLTIAVYVDVMVRVFARHEAPLDLAALVVGTAVVCTVYQARQGALPKGRARKALLAACLFAVLGAILGAVLAVSGAI